MNIEKTIPVEEKMEKAAQALKKNNMQVYIVQNCEEAVEKVGELLKKGYSCIYFSAPTLFSTIGDYKFHKSATQSVNPTEILYSCDLLVIDDLGTELTNSFCVSELLTLLNEREKYSKSTVISTNLSLEELNNAYSDRVFSRMFSNFEFCPLTGQDVRIYLKQMQTRK